MNLVSASPKVTVRALSVPKMFSCKFCSNEFCSNVNYIRVHVLYDRLPPGDGKKYESSLASNLDTGKGLYMPCYRQPGSDFVLILV